MAWGSVSGLAETHRRLGTAVHLSGLLSISLGTAVHLSGLQSISLGTAVHLSGDCSPSLWTAVHLSGDCSHVYSQPGTPAVICIYVGI